MNKNKNTSANETTKSQTNFLIESLYELNIQQTPLKAMNHCMNQKTS